MQQSAALIEESLFNKLFQHLLHIKQSYFDAHSDEDLIFRFLDKLRVRHFFSEPYLSQFIDALLTIPYLAILFTSPLLWALACCLLESVIT